MFILTSFSGKVPSEESPPHVHPEAEGLSGPSCHQEGEEHPVSSWLSFVPARGAPGVLIPSCLCVQGPMELSEKSWRYNNMQRQRKVGKTLWLLWLRKQNRCYKEEAHLTHETNCFNIFSSNKQSDKLSLSCAPGLASHVGSAGSR